MPELPEVTTVKFFLLKHFKNKKIENVFLFLDKSLKNCDKNLFLKLKNNKILDVLNVGKHLIIKTDNFNLLIHLRMEGKFILSKEFKISLHDIFCFEIENIFYFLNDTRHFATIYLYQKDIDLFSNKPLANVSFDPFSEKFTLEYFKNNIQKKSIKIYKLLLDQSFVAGIGNIYVSEILFLAKVLPWRLVNTLNDQEILDIIKYSRIVLSKAIEEGGSTIKSFKVGDNIGKFQVNLNVYQRTNQTCKLCDDKIKRIKINNRSSYYCEKCQK
ncbi:bifunctional DNA-formamidopyrimidine glycosylase/DNA-(apurinic or apyrimidinic site) lyase [symbiont of Argiope bruennichi]|uniref:bifunctional DNA-formamidopyrimidine glycosylase/DNA-(apurinic or apyrimidinic site) lyase n=1 Tax=symbiont of Argiope bruennichi TaxID=2810479 RepID=UPI003DA6A792